MVLDVFQFQKVRLKDNMEQMKDFALQISIPKGSIKSLRQGLLNDMVT